MSNVDKKVVFGELLGKLGYKYSSDLKTINAGPNSIVIHDKKADEVWKILKNKPTDNPYLEGDLLKSLPDSKLIVKHKRMETLIIKGREYHCLVFPYISGVSLYEKIKAIRTKKDKPFTLDDLKLVGKTVSEAISFLNKNGIIHQDIKPGNIILTDDNKVKLIDLGIARYITYDKKTIKKLEGPYAYLSPEKIGQVSGQISWTKLTFASDLYSLGAVLFEMTKLERLSHILPLSELYSAHNKLKSLGLKRDFDDYVSLFLLPDIFERQQKLSQILDIDWWEKPSVENERLWFHSSRNVVTKVYPEFIDDNNPKSPLGFIYNAFQVTSVNNLEEAKKRGEKFQSYNHLFALDPCTYLQQHDVSKQKGLKYLSYGKIKLNPDLFINPPTFDKDFGVKYVSEVLRQEDALEVDILISPYFYIRDADDPWLEANCKTWRLSYLKSKEIGKKLYFGILLSEQLLKSESDIHEVATTISQQTYVDNIYLRIESERGQSHPLTDENVLENLTSFVNYISRSKNILMAASGIEALGLLGHGVMSVSTNPEFSQRKFSLKDKTTVRKAKQGRAPTPRYFVRDLLNELLLKAEVEGGVKILKSTKHKNFFDCNCSYCPNRDPVSVKKHYLNHFDDMFSSLTTLTSRQKKISKFEGWLNVAQTKYNILRTMGVGLESFSDGNFIPIWRKILCANVS